MIVYADFLIQMRLLKSQLNRIDSRGMSVPRDSPVSFNRARSELSTTPVETFGDDTGTGPTGAVQMSVDLLMKRTGAGKLAAFGIECGSCVARIEGIR